MYLKYKQICFTVLPNISQFVDVQSDNETQAEALRSSLLKK
jgi:hypothetical protein